MATITRRACAPSSGPDRGKDWSLVGNGHPRDVAAAPVDFDRRTVERVLGRLRLGYTAPASAGAALASAVMAAERVDPGRRHLMYAPAAVDCAHHRIPILYEEAQQPRLSPGFMCLEGDALRHGGRPQRPIAPR